MAPWTTGRHSCSDFHVLSRSFCIIVIVITIGIIIGIIIIAIDIIFVVITIVVTVRLMSTEQAVTCVVTLNFYPQISGMFYRSASLYHPQRRAIMHLKNQKREENFLFLWIFIFIFSYSPGRSRSRRRTRAVNRKREFLSSTSPLFAVAR